MRSYLLPKHTRGFNDFYPNRRRSLTSNRNLFQSLKSAVRMEAKREIRNELLGIEPHYPKRVGSKPWRRTTAGCCGSVSKYKQYGPAYPYSHPEGQHPYEIRREAYQMYENFGHWAYESRVLRLKKRIQSHPWLKAELDRLETRKGKEAFIESYKQFEVDRQQVFKGDNKLYHKERERIIRDHWGIIMGRIRSRRKE